MSFNERKELLVRIWIQWLNNMIGKVLEMQPDFPDISLFFKLKKYIIIKV